MPYAKEHKAHVRQRIVRSARNLFNRKGYEAVTIDEVMAAAGLTRGGFYAHFRNKADLYREAVGFILQEHPARDWSGVDFDLSRGNAAEVIIDAYLSDAHFSDLERSCPLVTQASDAARGSAEVRAVYAEVLRAMTDAIGRSIAGSADDHHKRSLSVAALCVGGLALSRAVEDPELAKSIREASRDVALSVVSGGSHRVRSTVPAR